MTGIGKWWGRKPLILVRAAILGLLLPTSDDPKKDREIFLKLLTMDEEGLWRRKSKAIMLAEIFARLTPRECERWFKPESDGDKPKYKKEITRQEREVLQRIVFMRLSYDEKLTYCDRPEHIDGPSPQTWEAINAHLGTTAGNLPEFVQQIAERRFGHVPRVGDAFCGGGSVPFEAAQIGCEACGADLNPVAVLLCWAALHIVGGGEKVVKQVRQAQQEIYNAVNRQIVEWGIEYNERGWRADAYLYCNEVTCPECGWQVPLAPSSVIGEKTHCVAKLKPNEINHPFDMLIASGVSQRERQEANEAATVRLHFGHFE